MILFCFCIESQANLASDDTGRRVTGNPGLTGTTGAQQARGRVCGAALTGLWQHRGPAMPFRVCYFPGTTRLTILLERRKEKNMETFSVQQLESGDCLDVRVTESAQECLKKNGT